MMLTPAEALAELLAQHDSLRTMMDHCDQLANSLERDPAGDPIPLTREIARLRLAFDAHNKYEEQLLKPVLLEHDSFGAVRIDRMVDDHVQEHRAIGTRLSSTVVDELRDVIETLRAHLEAEERYLVTPRVLHDDLVSVESSD